MRVVMMPSTRDRQGSVLGRALRWKPRTHLGVCIVAVTAGAINLAGESVHPVWSLTTRVALALGLVGLGVVTGCMELRRRRDGQQWSATHPINLTDRAQGSPPSGDRLASGVRDAP